MPADKKWGGLSIPKLKCDLLQLLYGMLHSKKKLMWLNLPVSVNESVVFSLKIYVLSNKYII